MLTRLCDIYGQLLTPAQATALRLYLDEDLSLFEISQEANISRQGVLKNINAAKARLNELESKLGLCRILEGLERVRGAIRNGDNALAAQILDKILDQPTEGV